MSSMLAPSDVQADKASPAERQASTRQPARLSRRPAGSPRLTDMVAVMIPLTPRRGTALRCIGSVPGSTRESTEAQQVRE